MSRSLKEAAHVIADVVKMPHATVYERQRILFREGLLTGEGRGPGTGVRATPASVATLLIALLATRDSLDKTEDRTRTFLKLKATPSIVGLGRHRGRVAAKGVFKCPITGKTTFGDSLAELLTSPPEKVWLQVSPTRCTASITTDDIVSEFTLDGKSPPVELDGLHVAVSLFNGFTKIAQVIGGNNAR